MGLNRVKGAQMLWDRFAPFLRFLPSKTAIFQKGGNCAVADRAGHFVVSPIDQITMEAGGGIKRVGVLDKSQIRWRLRHALHGN
jgi:hypothetical protein